MDEVRDPLIYHRSTQLSKAKSQLISIADIRSEPVNWSAKEQIL